MDVKRNGKWWVECGRGHSKTKAAGEPKRKDYEVKYNLKCIVVEMGKGWKLFCRGDKKWGKNTVKK